MGLSGCKVPLGWALGTMQILGGPPGAETLVKAQADFMSFWARHGPPGAETLVNALADFSSFWAQHGPPGAETLVKA